MTTAVRAWICGGIGTLLVACGTSPDNVKQPAGSDESPVIVLGAPTPRHEAPPQPLEVAAPVAEPPAPSNTSDAELAALVRDPRKVVVAPRAIALLISEIQSLEALLASVPKNASDRPQLVRRLAEGYVELEHSALKDSRHITQTQSASAPELRRLEKIIVAARTAAIKHYTMLLNNHPGFCQTPHATDPAQSRGCLDEAHYFLGLELMRADKPDEARRQFLSLVKNFPASKWVPHAYLAFGEFFFAEAEADPSKLDFAKQTYEKTIQFPPPDNTAYGFAQYRLGQVHARKQDYQAALMHWMKAAEFATDYAQIPGSNLLGNATREQIVPVYAIVGSPQKAENFFSRIAKDPAGSNERLVQMLDALVTIYLRENKHADASAVCASSTNSGQIPACGRI